MLTAMQSINLTCRINPATIQRILFYFVATNNLRPSGTQLLPMMVDHPPFFMACRHFIGFVFLSIVFGAGCNRGPVLYPVSGTASYKGAPIKFGTIDFRGKDGSTAAAQIVDGKFDIPAISGLPPGTYAVSMSYPDPKIPPPMGNAPPGEALPNREMLPKKYNDQSELTAEVKAQPKNELVFDLK